MIGSNRVVRAYVAMIGVIDVLKAGHAPLGSADTSPAFGASGQEPTEVTQALAGERRKNRPPLGR